MVHRKKALALGLLLVTGVIQAHGKGSVGNGQETQQYKVQSYMNRLPALSSALLNAAYNGDLPGVQKAIKSGADIIARDYYNNTAIMIARDRGHAAVVTYLANRHLLNAAYRGDLAGVKAALVDGADINALDNYNKTAIMIARDRGHAAVAEYLKDVALSVMGTPKNTTSEKKLLK